MPNEVAAGKSEDAVVGPSKSSESASLGRAQEALTELAVLRGCPVIVIDSVIDDDMARTLYLCLRFLGRVDRLHILLSSGGGSIAIARKVLRLLHEYSSSYSVALPFRAASAGTIICLGASEIYMGPMSELSPIDPQIGSSQLASGSGSVAAAEVRGFRDMVTGWFHLRRKRDRLRIVSLLGKQIFAPTLGGLYRAEQFSFQTATLALKHQFPGAHQRRLERVASSLVMGQFAHDLPITIHEAKQIGLNIVRLSEEEESLNWHLWEDCQRALAPVHGLRVFDGAGVGVILAEDFSALRRQFWAKAADGSSESFIRWQTVSAHGEPPNMFDEV